MITVLSAVVSSAHHATGSDLTGFVLLYVGPDQMLPVMSALGAVLGVLLIVWRQFVSVLRKTFGFFARKLGFGDRETSAADVERT